MPINKNIMNKILLDWGDNKSSQDNTNAINVDSKEFDPKYLELRVWMKVYGLPKSEMETAKMIKEKYVNKDTIDLNQWEDACCDDFEAFAMIACRMQDTMWGQTPDNIKADGLEAGDLSLYDYSWFDGNCNDEYESIGDFCIAMAGSRKFYKDFKIIFNWAKKYKIDEETIWAGWRAIDIITHHPELEPAWGEKIDVHDLIENWDE